jgi:uncharacterized protein YprB with RNaseH-like and TPR domain
MLAFDIETTGLDKDCHDVTVVCMCGDVGGVRVEKVFNFARDGRDACGPGCRAMLSNAEVLCAMNGLRFDIPFLAKYLNSPDEESLCWMAKLYDPCEVKKNTNSAYTAMCYLKYTLIYVYVCDR